MSRPYVEVLRDLAGGEICAALDRRLADCVEAVLEHRGVGEIALTLKLKPNGEHTVEIVPAIKTKLPEPLRPRTMMFVDAHFGLRREDPRQETLPLRQVETPAGAPKRLNREEREPDAEDPATA